MVVRASLFLKGKTRRSHWKKVLCPEDGSFIEEVVGNPWDQKHCEGFITCHRGRLVPLTPEIAKERHLQDMQMLQKLNQNDVLIPKNNSR